ncbi:MAG TPA: PilZ domain-containing protein [Tepidisphaeraceae bacterium]|jgi:c-di-GMP-binding flagellar brake protein YcgR|nr:PilZ domain-containing protein [Tepidisphaeraceae bacterium]
MTDAVARSIFEQAIDEQWNAVAGIRHAERTHMFDARFVRRSERSFWFETSTWPQGVPNDVLVSGIKVTFEFGSKGRCVSFQAEVRSIELKPGAEGAAAIACCSVPSAIAVMQRRAHFRTPVPIDSPVSIVVWKIPPHWVLRDRPKPSMRFRIEWVDLSTGGMCLNILPHRAGPESVTKGDRLRFEIRFAESETILDGLVVYRADAKADGSIRIGVAFRKLENSIEGRRGLFLINRAISALQRMSIRQAALA